MQNRSQCICECHKDNEMTISHVFACCQPDIDREPQPSDGPEYHADHAYWALHNHEHDYQYISDDYGSLGDGGSHEVYQCSFCGKVKYSPLAD